jgi:hypothetical protein
VVTSTVKLKRAEAEYLFIYLLWEQKIGTIVLKWLASNGLAEKGMIMKKIIGLIVAVVVIWVVLKMIK